MNRALVITFAVVGAAFAFSIVFALILGWRARKYEYKARQVNPDDERPAVVVSRPLELEAAKS